MADKLTKSDKTILKGKKLKMAELLANPEFTGTNKNIYEAVGISHDTFYKWIKDNDVIEYTENLINKYTDGELGAIWKALIKKCKSGEIQAIKLYFELKGKYKNGEKRAESGEQGVILMPEVSEAS
jgi:hypothetical protein